MTVAKSKSPDIRALANEFSFYTQLKREYRAQGLSTVVREMAKAIKAGTRRMRALRDDARLARAEPNDLDAIRSLRPRGPRRLWAKLDRETYLDRLEGAFLARCAGCTLGAPVEAWSIERMANLAKETGKPFPPTDYWTRVPDPYQLRYKSGARESYTRDKMNGVPVDDDIVYTLLGLLVAEEYGPKFTIAQNGLAWMKHLPLACTAEEVALENLKKGIPAEKVGERGNPYCEWIGADIRSDPWGYMAPGWPEFAADMAYRDACLSHRRNGIYGEMYFSAVIAAAFAVNDPVEALEIGLTEIPRACSTAKAVRWALKTAPKIRNYKDARAAVDERYSGYSVAHTLNNACLTIWGITIGGKDVTRVISETVAMGLDNDCTAATAGSIVGAVVGRKGVPAHWTRPFNNTVHSYLKTHKKFRIDDLMRRFARQAERVHRG